MSTPSIGRSDVRIQNPAEATLAEQTVLVVDSLLRAWNEADEAIRRSILETCTTAEVVYASPAGEAHGMQELTFLIGEFIRRFPGLTAVRTSAIDLQHRFARFGWAVIDSAKHNVLRGIDTLVLDQTSKVAGIVTFYGPLPRITYTLGSLKDDW